MTKEELMQKAIEVSKNSYAPFSKFSVGACVLTENGKEYAGCNFENSSYGMTICAERNAIGSAVAAGEKKIKAVAIYSPNRHDCWPCGACLQVMTEFCTEDFVIYTNTENGIKEYTLKDFFPMGFIL